MKRIFSSLFLLLFLYNIIGYYPSFLYIQSKIKHEIKQRIKNAVPQEELTVLSFNEFEYKNLDWVESHEFRYNGDMYDVIRKKTDDKGNIIVFVINDKKEKELFVNLEEQTQKKF